MIRSRRAILAILTVLVLTLASRTDPGMRLVSDLLGPRVALTLGGQAALQGDGHATVGEQPAPAVAAPVAPAALAPGALAAKVTIEAAANVEQGYLLEARLLTKDAKPMNDTTVRFYDLVDLLGPREMLVGSALTDGRGVASLKYLPAEGGTHQIVTRSSAHGTFAATEGRSTFQATAVAPSSYTRELLPLSTFTPSLPYAAGAVLLGVWALFGVALLGTALRIVAAGRIAAPAINSARGVAGARPAARSKTREDLA